MNEKRIPGSFPASVSPLAGAFDGATVVCDPQYLRTLELTQVGNWQEANRLLTALERAYPDSLELRRARQLLALHLSAEQTWHRGVRGRLRFSVHAPAIRALLLANLLLYLLVGTLCLFAAHVAPPG